MKISPETFVEFLSEIKLRKARALAVYLVIEPGRERRSELIIDLLWQEAQLAKARASLRQTVRHLRVTSENQFHFPLITRNGQIMLDCPRDWRLFEDVAQGLSNPDLFQAARRTGLDLLDVFEQLLGISDNFDSWLAIARNTALSGLCAALEQVMARPNRQLGQEAAQFLLELDPCHEAAARFLMLQYWNAGAPNRAIELYNLLYQALDAAYDQDPESSTIELLAAIKLNPEGGPGKGASKRARPSRVTLVVEVPDQGPLDDRDSSFQTVLATDLRSRLGRFREWQVIASEPEDNDFLAIRPRLFQLDGQYRFLVEIVHPRNRELIWSEIMEDPYNDWVGKVRMLILNISNALQVVVADRQGKDGRAELYDRWLQSLALKGTWTHEDELRAEALLRCITQEAPKFGPAHAELAGIYNIRHILRPGTRQDPNLRDKALTHALDAVAADAMDTRAHRVLAWCYCHKDEFDLAEFHFEQSLQLNPQNTQTLASSMLGFAFCGNELRARTMLSELERLPETLEPFHNIYLAATTYLLGDFAAAAQHCAGGDGLMSTTGGWHCAALAKQGKTQAARQRLEQYHQEICALWHAAEAPDLHDVIDWYVACFPLRSENVREDLRHTLYDVAAQPLPAEALVAHVGDVDTHSTVEG
ncbi:SARP family transcriptional regulator [Pseudophaeobacter sp. EL27]|uniref:AfsR/SARP family transcriptional regulator n=1 Tax=Pseudophaeobacter sp. EL27 TaxID=2107580 RepID=UPI000EFA4878|nr:SARP family transcriptional regulator [Pseudophaeobacter sp. EL27]